MNANLKIVLALGAVVLAVFGITVISNFTTKEEKKPEEKGGGGADVAGEPAASSFEPIRYTYRQVFYSPNSENPVLREFPGFFEVNDEEHAVIYWLQNYNGSPTEVAALSRSCSACTSARLAIFPGKPKDPQTVAVSGAVLGIAGVELTAPVEREHRLRNFPAAEWKLLDFDHPDHWQTVPPAAEDGAPTWVALQIRFKVRQKGGKNLGATLGFKLPNQQVPVTTEFQLGFYGAPRFDVLPASIDFKTMAENVPSRTEEIIYWSATTPQDRFAAPQCAESPGEPFLTFSQPVALSETERQLLARSMSKAEFAMRVLGAYRVQVTLNRKNPAPKPGQPLELDIGPLEKSFSVFPAAGGGAESDPMRIPVKATVTGLVALSGGGGIDLGSFASREGVVKRFTLVSDIADLELELVPDKIEPKTLKAELEAPTNEEGRRYWLLKVRVAADATTGNLPNDSVIVLRSKSTGQLVRLPAKGHALVR